MTVRGGGVRKNHGFHAVVQNGSAASELSLPMRKTASWSGVVAAPPNTRLRHECSCATSELPSTRPSDHNERAAVLGFVKVWPGIAESMRRYLSDGQP